MGREYETFRRNLDLLVRNEGSMEHLAVRARIPYETLKNWRQRGTRPTIPSLEKLADTYGLKASDLLDRQLRYSDLG